MLRPDSRFSKIKEIPWKMIEKEAVLVDTEEGDVIRLNEVGAKIWKSLDEDKTADDIINYIHEDFEANRAVIEKDVLDFLKKLIAMEIIYER